MSQRRGAVRRITHCSVCNQFLDLRESEVATVCSRCGQGYHLENEHLRQIEVQFSLSTEENAALESVSDTIPFWVFTAEMPWELMNVLGKADPFAGLDIYVPGYALLWDERVITGARLTMWQPDFMLSSFGRLEGCTVSRQDALDVAPMVYMRVLQQLGGVSVTSELRQLPLLASKLMVLPKRFSQEELL